MNATWGDCVTACFVGLSTFALAGCAVPPPRDFGGHWRAVNRFDAAPRSIPLQRPYEYFASPLDGTLKAMLTRWAKDTGITLVYEWPDDYTLTTSVSGIHDRSLEAAVARLGGIYAAQGVSITATSSEIRVAPAADPTAGESGNHHDAVRTADDPGKSGSG